MLSHWTARILSLIALLLPSIAEAQGVVTNGANHEGSIAIPGEVDVWTFTADQGDTIILTLGEVPRVPDPGYWPRLQLTDPTGAPLVCGNCWNDVATRLAATAPLTGTYTVVVSSFTSGAVGDYVLRLAKTPGPFVVPGGDHGGALVNGDNHTGRIEVADVDMWTFTANLGDALIVTLGEIPVGPGVPDPGFWPWLRVYDPLGNALVCGNCWDDVATRMAAAAPLTGTYTVVVAGFTGDLAGDYTVRLARIPGTFEVPDGDHGGPLVNGENHTGRVERADLDLWTFTANQGDALIVTLGENPVGPGVPDPGFWPWLRVYDPLGNALVCGNCWNTAATRMAAAAPLTGTYTVVVAGYTDGVAGDYTVRLAKIPGTFEVPNGDHGGSLVNGENHAGRIERADLDMWTFTANQGDALIVTLSEIPVGPGVPDPGFWPWLRVYDPQGDALVCGNCWGDVATHMAAAAPLAGTYTVVVAGYTDEVAGDYTLRLAKTPGSFTIPAGDHGGAMTNGANHTGRIELGDLDIWTFSALQGSTITVNIGEIPVGPGDPDPGFWPWIRVFGPTGATVVCGNCWGNQSAQMSTAAPLTGTYRVVVASAAVALAGTGDYILTVTGAIPAVVPTTANDVYLTQRNVPLNVASPGVLANDNSNGGGPMTAQLETTVGQGTLALSATGSFTYTPPASFTGQTSFTYRAVNAFGDGNAATVTITVTAGTPPTTTPDGYGTTAGAALNVPAPGVLANDDSHGHGALSAELTSTTANGILALNADGSFSYTPSPGFVGQDSFTYRAVSLVGPGNTAPVTIDVFSTPQQPTSLYAAAIVGNTVTLRWTPPAAGPAPTGYVLKGGINPGESLATIPTGSAYPIYTFTAPTGAFYVRMHTLAGTELSDESNEIRIFVNQPGVAPSAPADLVGMATGSSIALAWRNTFEGGALGGIVLDVTGSLTASLPLGLTDSFQFNGVPGGTYNLSLRAVNGAGSSAPSNAISLTFPEPGCQAAPLTPANFLAYRLGRTIFVVWDPAATGGAPTSYTLTVTGAFAGSLATPARTLSGTVGAGTYHLSAVAANACGASVATPVQTVVVP